MDYYNRLQSVDKQIEDILKVRDLLIKAVTQACNKLLEDTLAELGQDIPDKVKENKRGRRGNRRTDRS